MEVGTSMTDSNLKDYSNFYADLAQSAYRGRPNTLSRYNNALNWTLIDYSQDIDDDGETLPEVKNFLMTVKSTCSRILIYTMFIKSQQFLFLIRTV